VGEGARMGESVGLALVLAEAESTDT
jgi:hypothetical protein